MSLDYNSIAMKVINYLGSKFLTCDSTLYTCDNAILTCDTITEAGGSIAFIKIIPREMVNTVYVSLYNELTFKTTNFTAPAINNKGYLQFNVPVFGMKEGDSFELTVRKDSYTGALIYRDKAYATSAAHPEDYKLTYPDSNGIIIM